MKNIKKALKELKSSKYFFFFMGMLLGKIFEVDYFVILMIYPITFAFEYFWIIIANKINNTRK